jgi:hypothetical protein
MDTHQSHIHTHTDRGGVDNVSDIERTEAKTVGRRFRTVDGGNDDGSRAGDEQPSRRRARQAAAVEMARQSSV